MRVAIVAGERESLVPSTLVAALAADGRAPAAVFRLRPPGRGRVRALLRSSRALRAVRRALRGGAAVDVASEIGRREFARFAAERGLSTWDEALAEACRRANAELVPIRGVNDPDAVRAVRDREIDLLLNLVPSIYREMLDAPRRGVLNPHMGPLPDIRGMNAAEWSVLLGRRTVVTVHFLAKRIDAGDVVLEHPLPVAGAESFEVLRGRSGPVFVAALCEAVAGLETGKIEPRPQPRGEGLQCYVMHPRIRALATKRLRIPDRPPA